MTTSGTPPDSAFRRGRTAWQTYRGLRRTARYSSMAWWRMKVIQGVVLGGLVIALAVILLGLYALLDPGVWLARLGLAVVLFGVLILVRYMAAPITARWIVTVPENWYYVVEDADGYTLEYLEPGRMIVPWRWNSQVVEYVNFNMISITETIEDILGTDSVPVALDITVRLLFNPTRADPNVYATLRQMTKREQFEAVIARDVRDIVYRYLSRIATMQGQRSLLKEVESLETTITEELQAGAPLGLTPAPNRPVQVHVRVPPQVREAYQALWERSARVREESKVLLDIRTLAQELNIPYEEAFQLFYIMQHGMPTAPAPVRRSPKPGTPPVVIVQPSTHPPDAAGPPAHTPSDFARQTAEHQAVPEPATEPPVLPAESPPTVPTDTGPTLTRLIEDAASAPDPFDVRRRRRDERRSRRA